MEFIELTLSKGNKVLVNVNKIIDIGVYGDGKETTVSFSENYYYKVKETYEEMKELIGSIQY